MSTLPTAFGFLAPLLMMTTGVAEAGVIWWNPAAAVSVYVEVDGATVGVADVSGLEWERCSGTGVENQSGSTNVDMIGTGFLGSYASNMCAVTVTFSGAFDVEGTNASGAYDITIDDIEVRVTSDDPTAELSYTVNSGSIPDAPILVVE